METASLSLEIGILVQIGVLIIMKLLYKYHSKLYSIVVLCLYCVKCMLKLCMVMYNYTLSL